MFIMLHPPRRPAPPPLLHHWIQATKNSQEKSWWETWSDIYTRWHNSSLTFFQDFLLGPFFAEKIEFSWTVRVAAPPPPPSINVVEMQSVKAGALRDTINWLKMANA